MDLERVVLVRHGEIWVKGGNRFFFERLLARNCASALSQAKVKDFKVMLLRGRILVKGFPEMQSGTAVRTLRRVFGVSSVSPATEVDNDIESLKVRALEIAGGEKVSSKKSFRITTKRLTKTTPLNSNEISRLVGETVFESLKAKVDLAKPRVNIQIEVFKDKAFLFTEKLTGVGGLPVGSSGKAGVVLDSSRESLLTALLMLKRGCTLLCNALKGSAENRKVLALFAPVGGVEFVESPDFDETCLEKACKALAFSDFLPSEGGKAGNLLFLYPLTGFSAAKAKSEVKRFLGIVG